MKPFCSIGLSLVTSIVLVGGSAAVSRAQTVGFPIINNVCGNAMTVPHIFSGGVVSPPTLNSDGTAPANWNPSWARMVRGGILYVSANFFRINITTDQCTYINAVSLGSSALTTTYTDGYWFVDQAAYPQPSDPTRYTHAVSVFFPYQPDGSTETVRLVVGRTLGSGTATY